MSDGTPAIGVIGGSGLYQIEGLEKLEELVVEHAFWTALRRFVSGYVKAARFTFCRGTLAAIGCFQRK